MEIILLVIAGWLVGILINRAADNLPAGRAFAARPSCRACHTPRAFAAEIAPFVARCSQCGTPLGARPSAVLIADAIAYAVLWLRFGPGTPLLLACAFTSILLLVLVTDLEHRLIFNIVIFPAIAFAAITSNWSAVGWKRSLVGGVLALIIVLGIYYLGKLFERMRGLHIEGGAFGQGDVTLATFIGLITGFPAVTNALVWGILLGGVGAVALLTYHGVAQRRLALDVVFAYGPYLCIAGWLAMVLPT